MKIAVITKESRAATELARAFTFEGKDPAFYIDRAGNKVEVRW